MFLKHRASTLGKIPAFTLLLALVGCSGSGTPTGSGHGQNGGESGPNTDAAEAEMKKFEGTWYSYAIEVDGKQQTVENRDDLFIFSWNKWTHKFKGRVVAEGTFTVKEHKPYKVIHSEYTAPEKQKGGHWIEIYRFDGDTLQWLGDNEGDLLKEVKDEDYKKLPKAFETRKGDNKFMRTVKRLTK